MKLPLIAYEIVGHRLGEDPPKVCHDEIVPPTVDERLRDLLPLKLRRTDDASVAQRLRQQFLGRAYRAHERCVEGLPAVPVKKDRSDVGGPGRRNRDAAIDALQKVRLALYDRRFNGSEKSNNKRGPRDTARRQDASETESDPFRFVLSAQELTPGSAGKAASRSVDVWSSRTLNCGALASAAQDYLMHQCPTLQTSTVVVGGIHGLVAIGTVDASVARLPLAQWPRHVHVCDPWANLTCPAPDYPQRFVDKLARWEAQGKELFISGQWTSPLDERWTSCVQGVPRVYVRRHYRDGQFLESPLGHDTRGAVR